tara:strand:- start:27530 stop:30088 length:2559 start_codon:yes stop_codon:yes gene_type:complete
LQVRSFLNDKGIDEDKLIEELNNRGINIENMSESDILLNQEIIKKTIEEMQESDESFSPVSNNESIVAEDVIIQNNPDNISEEIQLTDNISLENIEFERYGLKIFNNNSLISYNISKDASPPNSYILGPGDKINVLIFGASQVEFFYEINAEGFIKPSSMPKIFISGLTLKKAQKMLKSRFSKFYSFKEDEFALTLNTSRTITVNIFGEVNKVGSYTSSALNTALNILSEAGGPTEFGSVRNIQIIRGAEKRILDVYDFMTNPNSAFKYSLLDNDIIYVPPVKKVISIDGAVSRPMLYELNDGEGINELLNYAGGLTDQAYTGLIQVSTIIDNKPILNDYSLNDVLTGKINLSLNNGDEVLIKSINETFEDYVSISGAINYDGIYPLNSTKFLKDLLSKAKIKKEAKTDVIFIIRKKIDKTEEILSLNFDELLSKKSENFELKSQDEIIIFDKEKFSNKFSVSVTGEVRDSFERLVNIDNKISILEAINLAGGLTEQATDFGFIYRNSPLKTKDTEYIKVNFPKDYDKSLDAGDQLIVYNKNNFKLDASIQLLGEVNNPVNIRFDQSLTLKDLLLMGQGVTASSNLNNIDIYRYNFFDDRTPLQENFKISVDENFDVLNNNNFDLQPFDVVVVRGITNYETDQFVTVNGQVNNTGIHGISEITRFSEIIKMANGLTEYADLRNSSIIRTLDDNNLIIFDPTKAFSRKNSIYDPILKKGDIINVPKLDNLVTINVDNTNYVLSEKQQNVNVVYSKRKSAMWYINKYSSGLTKDADKSSITTYSPSGIIKITRKKLFFINKYPKVFPGDIISVKSKPEKSKENREKKPLDWDSFTTKLISVGTFYLLTQSIINN